MAVLSYKDPGTGQWVALAGPAGATGPAGNRGSNGPNVVSADAGNTAVLGTDGLPFVPGADTASMDLDYVNLSGDTMTGELTLPDQIVTPPSVPTTVAAKGYVDQVVTASDAEPTGIPVRDGLVWVVVEDVVVRSVVSLTYRAAAPASFTVSGAYTVDWGDGSAVETYAAGAAAAHTYAAGIAGTAVVEAQADQSITSFILAGQNPVSIVFDAASLTHLELRGAAGDYLEQVDFAAPVVLDSCHQLFWNHIALVSITGSLSSSGTTWQSTFSSCENLTVLPTLDTSGGTNFSSMFNQCHQLTTMPLFDTSAGTDFKYMFEDCRRLTTIPAFDFSSGTEFDDVFDLCIQLESILAFGARYDIWIVQKNMEAPAINTFFTNLGTVVPINTATVYIADNPGTSTCDITIATAKGWIVNDVTLPSVE